jgi:hypothetical protein
MCGLFAAPAVIGAPFAPMATRRAGRAYNLISMSTPAARSSFMSDSTVFVVV